ncbi:MAG: dihydroorotate dehydrogenase [Dehalococcoidia bacterium]
MTTNPSLRINLAPRHPRGLHLANPVMIASGLFGRDGFGSNLPEGMDPQRLGALVAKTVTAKPLAGSPEPRWYPYPSWRRAWEAGERILLNNIGLTNPGIERVLGELAPLWAQWQVPVVLSIAGESVEEFGQLASTAEGVPGLAAIELNLSCPNIEGGMLFGQNAQVTSATVRRVKEATSLPVLAKLTPNVADIVPIAEAAVEAGADALVLVNTLQALAIDVETRRPVLGGVLGGLSGPGLKPVALAMVYRVAQRIQGVPIIGVGGVMTGGDAVEYLLAGATAVQVGSANQISQFAPLRILEELEQWLVEHRVGDVHELIGAMEPPQGPASS